MWGTTDLCCTKKRYYYKPPQGNCSHPTLQYPVTISYRHNTRSGDSVAGEITQEMVHGLVNLNTKMHQPKGLHLTRTLVLASYDVPVRVLNMSH